MSNDINKLLEDYMIDDFIIRLEIIREIGWDRFWSMEEKLQWKMLDKEYKKLKKDKLLKDNHW